VTCRKRSFYGRFDDHHAFLLAKMLARIDAIVIARRRALRPSEEVA